MGIPTSKSRAIEVDGQKFRWMARKGLVSYRPRQRAISRILTVQEAAERPGRVLQVILWPRKWSDWDEMTLGDSDEMSLLPTDVLEIIQEALLRGWEPGKRGAALKDKITVSTAVWSTSPPPKDAPTKRSTRNPAGPPPDI